MAGEFETFVQTELPLRPYVSTNPAQETVLVRRGAGPRQLQPVTVAEGEVLGMKDGTLQSVKIGGPGGVSAVRTVAHTQSSASTVWTIAHGYSSTNALTQVFDGSGEAVIPGSIRFTDANTITITFNVALAGTAKVIFLD